MEPYQIIDKYIVDIPQLKKLLIVHSEEVTRKSLAVVDHHPELGADRQLVSEAGMLHDIGIFLTDAPRIYCYGKEPYLRHGYLGAELMRREGFPRHARVCERHTGAGLTAAEILEQHLPLPPRDFLPETVEEKIICYADKFYSKSNLYEEKSIEQVLRSLRRFGGEGEQRFREWHKFFSC